jgi:hypothetical protein
MNSDVRELKFRKESTVPDWKDASYWSLSKVTILEDSLTIALSGNMIFSVPQFQNNESSQSLKS